MKNIKVVIGANFGDEGKGMLTDYFCELFPSEESVLNVRFNGTSQAGHTVERGLMRHVFSHIGAGSLNKNVVTLLSSYFYISPIKFNEECETLLQMGVIPAVLADEKCCIITPFDVIFGNLIEVKRGAARHGSCGAGLWEAVCREKAGFKFPLNSLKMDDKALSQMITNIRDIYYSKRFKESGLRLTRKNPWHEIWYSNSLIVNYLAEIRKMQKKMTAVNETAVLNVYRNQVYEGAQGLLLDWDNTDYMPNLTASYTGLKSVLSLWALLEETDFQREVCYVTRTYLTRHGPGRFDTQIKKKILGSNLTDKTNKYNQFQGNLRWGYFDPELFEKTIKKDLELLNHSIFRDTKVSIAFTHFNKTLGNLLMQCGKVSVEEYVRTLSIPGLNEFYISIGEQAGDIIEMRL